MATVAEYLTTEYTLQDHGLCCSLTRFAQIRGFDAYPREGTPLCDKTDKRNFRHFGEKPCYILLLGQRVEAKACPMTIPHFEDRAPADDRITVYDERHFVTYLRLLDAADEGADWREVVQIIFGLDASIDPGRAQAIHDSHLERARWMTTHGYRQLLEMARRH